MTRHMVVLTGWAVGKFPWKTLFSLLEKHFEITFVDWEDIFSIDGFKKKVLHLIDDKKNFSLMGWSLGAMVALEIAKVLFERIDNLILISGTLKFVNDKDSLCTTLLSKDTIDKMIYMLKSDKDSTLNKFYKNFFSKSEKTDGHYERFIDEMRLFGSYYNINSLVCGLEYLKTMDFREIPLPLSPLLIHGDSDIICPYKSSEYIKEKYKNSNLIKLQNTGHIPFYTHPHRCYEIIKKYLEVESL